VVYQGQPPCDPKTLGGLLGQRREMLRGYAAGRDNVRCLSGYRFENRIVWASPCFLMRMELHQSFGATFKLYLAGLLSHLDRKNAETIAALVDVERLVLQESLNV
jgi:hypothetical protein